MPLPIYAPSSYPTAGNCKGFQRKVNIDIANEMASKNVDEVHKCLTFNGFPVVQRTREYKY